MPRGPAGRLPWVGGGLGWRLVTQQRITSGRSARAGVWPRLSRENCPQIRFRPRPGLLRRGAGTVGGGGGGKPGRPRARRARFWDPRLPPPYRGPRCVWRGHFRLARRLCVRTRYDSPLVAALRASAATDWRARPAAPAAAGRTARWHLPGTLPGGPGPSASGTYHLAKVGPAVFHELREGQARVRSVGGGEKSEHELHGSLTGVRTSYPHLSIFQRNSGGFARESGNR